MYNVTPFFPCLLLYRHQFGAIVNVQDNGFVFVADTPAENGRVISVAQDKTFQMFFGCFPEEVGVQFRTTVAGPVGCFIQYADPHFISHIKVEAGIDLRVRTDCVGIHPFNGGEPGPRITAGHLRDTHKMPGVTMQCVRFAVQVLCSTLQCPFTPAETFVFGIDSLFLVIDGK